MENNAIADVDLPHRRSRASLVAAIGILLVCAAVAWFMLQHGVRAGAEDVLADFGTVPNVTLTERSGASVALGELKGKIWVANFIFTRCGGSCPAMSAKMSELQTSLRKAGDVMLVSFTVDPENDTPERLAAYADGYKAEKDTWLFLTGRPEQMQKLAKESFLLAIEEGTDPLEPIIHSKRFVLVDRDGDIRGYYNSEEPEAKQRLLHDIGILMRGDAR